MENAAKKRKITEEKEIAVVPSKLSSEMLTLSSAPRAKLKSIVNLEQIKARNKPVEPPKAPKSAPFFLGTLSNTDQKFITEDLQSKPSEDEENESSRILNFSKFRTLTPFMKRLQSPDDYDSALEMLVEMSPSAIDLEIRQLVTEIEIKTIFNFIEYSLEQHVCFELVQALLNILLKVFLLKF